MVKDPVHGPWTEEAWRAHDLLLAVWRAASEAMHEDIMEEDTVLPPDDEKLEFKAYEGRLRLWEGATAESFVTPRRWAEGPWSLEPDRIRWHHAGFPCLLLRHPRSGHLCGYVGVPSGHPLHGRNFRSVKALSVHGGLSYSSTSSFPICHSPEDASTWFFGFDANHADDDTPFFLYYVPTEFPGYRDVHYMAAEVADLAEQLEHGQWS